MSARTAVKARSVFALSLTASVVLLAFVPFAFGPYAQSFFLILLMHVTLATSWNMMSGYTGYLSFGHGVFFGLGAYTFALLKSVVDLPWPVALLSAGLVAAAFAFILGLIFMRVPIRIAYFSIATLGLNEIVKTIIANASGLGGSHGITLIAPPQAWLLYSLLLATTCITVLIAYWLDGSYFGLGLKAVLQDEGAAEVSGVPTFPCKLGVFVLSAFFPGITGAIIGWNWSYIDPYMAFDLVISFDMAVMAVFGGIGSFLGPILGALGMGAAGEVLWVYIPNLHGLIYGVLVAIIIVTAPGGLVQIGQRIRRRLSRHGGSYAKARSAP